MMLVLRGASEELLTRILLDVHYMLRSLVCGGQLQEVVLPHVLVVGTAGLFGPHWLGKNTNNNCKASWWLRALGYEPP